jgi:hypothetical protein
MSWVMQHFTVGEFLGLMLFAWYVIVCGVGLLFMPRPKPNAPVSHDLDIFTPESPPCP